MDDDTDTDDIKQNKSGKKCENEMATDRQRWIVLFYRICGCQDGFQRMMAMMFYSKDLFALMDLSDDLNIGTKAQREALGQLAEQTATFASVIDR